MVALLREAMNEAWGRVLPPTSKRYRAMSRFLPSCLLILAICACSIWGFSQVIDSAVKRDATRRSEEWAQIATHHIADLAAFLADETPDPAQTAGIHELFAFGGVLQFKLFDADGALKYDSAGAVGPSSTLARESPEAAAAVRNGHAYTLFESGRSKANRPDLYSETYLPVYHRGQLVAVAETYLDQTETTRAVRSEYAVVGLIVVAVVLAGVAIPFAGLLILSRRLRTKNAELEEERARAESSDKAKNEFLAVVSHELRTPLTSIKASLALLRSGEVFVLPSGATKLVEMAARNSEILHSLVNDLLDFERLDSGNLSIETRPADLVEVVKTMVNGIACFGAERDVRVVYVGASRPLIAEIDAERVGQVIRNLLSNAIKFSPQGEEVQVAVFEVFGVLRVTVKDNGSGIKLADRARIFDRFTQVDSSDTRNHNGAGLGLAISKRIIDQHGGKIGATGSIDGGSLFYFDLPRCRHGLEPPEGGRSAVTSGGGSPVKTPAMTPSKTPAKTPAKPASKRARGRRSRRRLQKLRT